MAVHWRSRRTTTTSVIMFRHQHLRQRLMREVRVLAQRQRREERELAHATVVMLARAARRREARARRFATLFTMFRVKTADSEVAADTIHAPAQQQQMQQQQQQQQDKQQESSPQANSSTESEHSMVSGESGEASPGVGVPATLWGIETPRRQRALSVDVPSEAPSDTPRRRSAPEVVVTHVSPLEDDAALAEASQNGTEGESRQHSPTQAYAHTPSPPSPGRLSPTATLAPTSPPRSPRRLSRPSSHLSRIAQGSLAFRKGSTSGANHHGQDSVILTEVSAPLEDSRSVGSHTMTSLHSLLSVSLNSPLHSLIPSHPHPLTSHPPLTSSEPPHATLFTHEIKTRLKGSSHSRSQRDHSHPPSRTHARTHSPSVSTQHGNTPTHTPTPS